MAESAEFHELESVRSSFEKLLNRHGYAFQYSVLKQAEEAFNIRRISQWRFEASEVPVRSEGKDTRIDFILARHRRFARLQWYLICECKRVNPARAHWCFTRAPYVHSKHHSGYQNLSMECVERAHSREISASAQQGNIVDCYSLGLAVRSDEQGDAASKSDRDAIELAAFQVMTGVNGFVKTLEANPRLMTGEKPGELVTALLIPAIFTTAKLWVSDSNLSDAGVSEGRVDLTSTEFKQVPWIWFSYHTSPGLRLSIPRRTFPVTLPQLMDDDYIRHIAIVNSTGIDQFLQWSSDADSLLS